MNLDPRSLLVCLLPLFGAQPCIGEILWQDSRVHLPQPTSKHTFVGKVVDSEGYPLEGAIIRVTGTKLGTASRSDGTFVLTLSSPGRVHISVSYVGMQEKQLDLMERDAPQVIVLQPGDRLLDEVIKTGYYTTKYEKVAGSYALVPPQALLDNPALSIDHRLQGVIPGMVVTLPSGQPGASAKIRIRGTGTIYGDAEPLWVVDGVPVQEMLPGIPDGKRLKSEDLLEVFKNGLSEINPDDIESITVLKDAAANAIYGSRSAGGVIVITTKRGSKGRTRVNFSSRIGWKMRPQRSPQLMNSREKIAWERELWDEFAAPNVGVEGANIPVVGIVGMVYTDKIGKGGKVFTEEGFDPMTAAEKESYLRSLEGETTDWFGEIFRNGVTHDSNLSVSGGTDRLTYFTSLRYTSEEGLIKSTSMNRYLYNLRMQIDLLNKRLRLLPTISLSHQQSGSFSTAVSPVAYAYFANPYEHPFNPDGSYRPDHTYQNLSEINNGRGEGVINPLGINILRDMDEAKGVNKKISGKVSNELLYSLAPDMELDLLGSYTFGSNYVEDVVGKNTSRAYASRMGHDAGSEKWDPYGNISQTTNLSESYLLRASLRYARNFRVHDLRLLAGSEVRGNKNLRTFSRRWGYDPETHLQETPRPDPERIQNPFYYADMWDSANGQVTTENKYASFYLSGDYVYDRRYILNSSFRMDGSNNFGSKEQFNPTWSLGVAVHFLNEPYLRSLRSYLSHLTLRASSGLTGNVVQGVDKELVVQYNDMWKGHRIGDIKVAPNPNLRWEKTWDRQMALSLGDKLDYVTLLLEAYDRMSYDVIATGNIVSTTGFATQKYNASTIRNMGLEATLSARLLRGKDYGLRAGANIAWNDNRIVKFVSSTAGGISDDRFKGYPLGSIFLSIPEGIDPSAGLYTFRVSPQAVIGSERDKKMAYNYRFWRGTQYAPLTGGINLTADYKGLHLYVNGHYSLGATILNKQDSPASFDLIKYASRANEVPQTHLSDLYRNHLNVPKNATDRWTPERPNGAKYPRIVDAFGPEIDYPKNPKEIPWKFSDIRITNGIYVRKVNYLRINTVVLSYDVPLFASLSKHMRSLQVGCTAANLLTFTDYDGFDPESPSSLYPVTRSVSLTLRMAF